MFVTDAKGNLKMFPLWTRAKRHDDEVGLFANANPQPPQPQLPLPQVEVPSPPGPAGEADGPSSGSSTPDPSYPLVGLAAQPLAGRVPNASNTLLEPRMPTVPTVPVVSTSVLPHETPRSLLTDPHPHPSSHLVSSLPASLPHLAGWVNHRASPPLCHFLQPYRELERRLHGHGAGIRGPAAQRASCTHPAASGAELCL